MASYTTKRKNLTGKQIKAIELLVYKDMLKQEIAEEVGVSTTTFSMWMRKEEFQEALKEEMHRGFKDMATKARRRLNDLMDSPIDGVALGACKEVLNKAGYLETQKVENTITNKEINIEITD
jgi:predicted DNA-binding protein YlxM (UPF0122 family)